MALVYEQYVCFVFLKKIFMDMLFSCGCGLIPIIMREDANHL